LLLSRAATQKRLESAVHAPGCRGPSGAHASHFWGRSSGDLRRPRRCPRRPARAVLHARGSRSRSRTRA
jgi:hypothetical protein